jgi:threonine dehydratase
MPSSVDFRAIPTIHDIRAAAERLSPYIVTTPLLESPALNERIGGRLLIKAECLQRTGSFKFRGALNRLMMISEKDRDRGVVAFSSGNHAQGVAAAAQLLGVPAVIVMPADAPQLKINNTRGYGAEVRLYDRDKDDRLAIALTYSNERGMTFVPPFDDAGVIAGQGTAGLELAAQARAIGANIDAVSICCGGGGLASGVAIAVHESFPNAMFHTAEPAGFDDAARSLAAGRIESNSRSSGSICDALLSQRLGDITFPALRNLGASGLTATDDEARDAMIAAFIHLKLVLEPGGAIALATLLNRRIDTRGKTLVAIASGGNVDPALYIETLRKAA